MQRNVGTVTRSRSTGVIATNSVIRNTYILLSMTLIFSACTAMLSMWLRIPSFGLGTLLVYMGLFYLVNLTRNSFWGVVSVFALTGFMGLTLGPMLNAVMYGFSNGPQIIAASLGLTGAIFFALSGYAMTTRKDFSYLGGFLVAGFTVAFVASLIGIFFHVPALYLAISSGFVLLSSGFILYHTSQMIHGGERNYIMATISLYVQIYNLFISLLHILSALSGRND